MQITKATKIVKKFLGDYNKAYLNVELHASPVQFSEIISSDSNFWTNNDSGDQSIPSQVRHSIINSTLIMRRGMEEREMILKELSNIVQYYECIITVLTNHIFQDDKTNLGAINILKQYLERIIHAKRSAKLMYDKALGVSEENDSSEEDVDDDSDLSEEENDDDDFEDENGFTL